jgi:hypothetical protein
MMVGTSLGALATEGLAWRRRGEPVRVHVGEHSVSSCRLPDQRRQRARQRVMKLRALAAVELDGQCRDPPRRVQRRGRSLAVVKPQDHAGPS